MVAVRTSRHLQSRCGLHVWLCTDMESITISLLLQQLLCLYTENNRKALLIDSSLLLSEPSPLHLLFVLISYGFCSPWLFPSSLPVLFCSFLCVELTFSFFLLCIFGLEKLISLLFKGMRTYREQRNRAREMVLILISVN